MELHKGDVDKKMIVRINMGIDSVSKRDHGLVEGLKIRISWT